MRCERRLHDGVKPSLRSEVFKPCVEDKDLAFCLNEGECSIIETVAGVHRQCRCKEGYHGLRCDQFVPKTDAILSDPSTLSFLFLDFGDTYQRQVLSIFSIASGMCLLGAASAAPLRDRWKTDDVKRGLAGVVGVRTPEAGHVEKSLNFKTSRHGPTSPFSIRCGTLQPNANAPHSPASQTSKRSRRRNRSLAPDPILSPRESAGCRLSVYDDSGRPFLGDLERVNREPMTSENRERHVFNSSRASCVFVARVSICRRSLLQESKEAPDESERLRLGSNAFELAQTIDRRGRAHAADLKRPKDRGFDCGGAARASHRLPLVATGKMLLRNGRFFRGKLGGVQSAPLPGFEKAAGRCRTPKPSWAS
uniref:EGF-like domain-containing protein n=1 Tax=Hippocampus comes TaxID=109280 RepID=A0A3Q2XC36_HIPCM